MRTAYFDSDDPEMYFDNPNLIMDDPAYLLEPGDPGYIPPLIPNSEPSTKVRKHKMKTNRFFPKRTGDQVTWLGIFGDKPADYATAIGWTVAQIAANKADCDWLAYVLGKWLPETRTWGLGCTKAATATESGTGTDPQVLPIFTAPELPQGVTPVAPGALNRILARVQQIKDSGKCTDEIARILGIVGSEQMSPDSLTLKPEISVIIIDEHVLVKWGWGGHSDWLDSCEIHVDRGDGKGFVLLTIDTTPGYTDTQPFPATPTKWTYKAIYRANDAHTGNWSAPVSITVGG